MEFNQVFKAPSIPKISKKNIASPVIRGAIKPQVKLRRSVFNFARPSANQDISQQLARPTQKEDQASTKTQFVLVDTLNETNRILTEIQKQLSLDFANRIAEEKEALKKIKAAKEKKKVAGKEESVESIKKIGDVLTKPLGLITKPIKSIFDRIKEFFSILFTGLVLNNIFNWLSKKENREKLYNFFKFLVDNWKVFAAIIVGGLAIKALYKIIRLVQAVKGILRFLRILPKKGGAPGGLTPEGERTRGGLFRTAEGARRGIATEKTGQLRQTYDRYDPNSKPGSGLQEIYKRDKTRLGKTLQTVEVLTAKAGSDILKKIGLGPGAKGILGFLRPIFKRIPVFGALMDFALSLALGEPIGRAAAKAVGAALGGALGSFIPIPGVGTVAGGILGDLAGGAIYDAIVGKGNEGNKKGGKPEKKEFGGEIKGPSHAAGGVKIEAEGGEFITRKSEVPRFRPVLQDINDNGGRLWDSFTQGVKKQQQVTSSMAMNVGDFQNILTEYKKIVEDEKKRLEEKKRKQMGSDNRTSLNPPPAPSLPPPDQSSASNGSGTVGSGTGAATGQSSTETTPSSSPTSGSAPSQSPGQSSNITPTSSVIQNKESGAPQLSPVTSSRSNLLNPAPRDPSQALKPEEGKGGMVTLPPITMNTGGEQPKIEMPTYNTGKQSYPTVSPIDSLNDYLEIALCEYYIQGITL